MDVSAAFVSAEDWRAILVTTDDLGPYLLLALSLMLLWNSRRLHRDEGPDDDRPDGQPRYHAAEDPSDYDDELGARQSDDRNAKLLAANDRSKKIKRKKWRCLLRRSSPLNSFLGLVMSGAGIGLASIELLYPTSPPPRQPEPPVADRSIQPKSPEEFRFQARVIEANGHRARGDDEAALLANREAMKFPNISIAENAEPLINIAEMLLDQEQFDRAYWPALIAAGVRSDQPRFVNPFAEVLLEFCEVDEAGDWLGGLGIDKDERSHQLLARAETKRAECPQP